MIVNNRRILTICISACLSALSACGGEQITEPALGTGSGSVYFAPQGSALTLDSRLREGAPDRQPGSLSTNFLGLQQDSAIDVLFMDSSVVFLDSILQSKQILACTLWVMLNRMPSNDGDSVVANLWSVSEEWDELGVSWNSRRTGVLWQTPGGSGELVESALFSVKRINLLDFEFSVRGSLYDTVDLLGGRHVPIPIANSLAEDNYLGRSFGIALRVNPATTTNATIGIVSAQSAAVSNEPIFIWNYR